MGCGCVAIQNPKWAGFWIEKLGRRVDQNVLVAPVVCNLAGNPTTAIQIPKWDSNPKEGGRTLGQPVGFQSKIRNPKSKMGYGS